MADSFDALVGAAWLWAVAGIRESRPDSRCLDTLGVFDDAGTEHHVRHDDQRLFWSCSVGTLGTNMAQPIRDSRALVHRSWNNWAVLFGDASLLESIERPVGRQDVEGFRGSLVVMSGRRLVPADGSFGVHRHDSIAVRVTAHPRCCIARLGADSNNPVVDEARAAGDGMIEPEWCEFHLPIISQRQLTS